MPEPVRLQDIVVPAGFILVLLLLVLIMPQLGILAGIFSPVPLIFIYLQRGRETGLVSVGAVIIVIMLVLGIRYAIFFAAEYGILALVMAETIRLRFPLDRTIFFGALATAGASGILLFSAFVSENVSPGEFLHEQVKGHLLQSLSTLKDLDQQNPGLEILDEETISSLAKKLAWSYPAFIFSGSLFVTLINYGVVRLFWRRFRENSRFFTDSFSRWTLPDFFIWILIGSAITIWFASENWIFALGLNALIFTIVVYCLQGLAISVFFLEAKSIPIFLWVALFIFIFTQPFLIGILIGMGVFDLWVDFRKLKPKIISPDLEDEE